MSKKLSHIIDVLEGLAPKYLAEPWDNVGLQVGDCNQEIKKVLLTLDVTKKVIKEAIEQEVDLIISHHPFIFKGLKSISANTEMGRMIKNLIQNEIAIYVAHTNLDKAEFGLNHYVAEKLGLIHIDSLLGEDEKQVKLIVFSPESHTQKIIGTIKNYSLGSKNRYDSCTFRSSGIGTFRPLEGSNPFIGELERLESVKEDRIEMTLLKRDLNKIIELIKEVHPYEEMAYDIYPIEDHLSFSNHGLGTIGNLPKAVSSKEWIDIVKNNLELEELYGAGVMPEKIKRVSLCTGAGADLMEISKLKGAEVFITGDLKYHDGQKAEELGLWVINAGHFGTEKWVSSIFLDILQKKLKENCPVLIKSQESKGFFKKYD